MRWRAERIDLNRNRYRRLPGGRTRAGGSFAGIAFAGSSFAGSAFTGSAFAGCGSGIRDLERRIRRNRDRRWQLNRGDGHHGGTDAGGDRRLQRQRRTRCSLQRHVRLLDHP